MSTRQREIQASPSATVLTALAMILVLGPGLWGCKRTPEEGQAPAPVTVTVSHPVQREVTDYAEFTARTVAVDSVEVRARVWGYLEKVNFKEGALVHQGDVLFEIDPRTYQVELAQAEANIAQAEARRKNIEIDYHRIQAVLAKGAATPQEADKITASLAEAEAAVRAATAARDLAGLNLGFTKITAPVTGRVGLALVTEGNLIQSGQISGTLLTTLVSVDPIYAYFDVDERTVLRVKQLIRAGKLGTHDKVEIPVWLSLADEEGHPHQGTVDFTDNQVNPRTGTLRVRGVFPNADESLSPGYFARVRVPVSTPHQALLVTERALDTDQGQKVVYVVDGENRVASRPVQLGALHDGLREITTGLQPGDRVIVKGIQLIRPGAVVAPNLVDMPTTKAPKADEATPLPTVTSNH